MAINQITTPILANPNPYPDGQDTDNSPTVYIATGTNQASAVLIRDGISVVTNVTSTNGVRLPVMFPGRKIVIFPSTATQGLTVYPPVGGQINFGGVNTPVVISARLPAVFIDMDSTGNWTVSSGGTSVPVVPTSPVSSGLVAWGDPSDTATISQVGGSVSQMSDKSGSGNNFTQATGARQPQTGGALNGLNALTMNGSQYFDQASTLYSLPNGNYTIMMVIRPSSNLGDADKWIYNIHNANATIAGQAVGSGGLRLNTYNSNSGFNNNSSNYIPQDKETHVFSSVRNGALITGYRDAATSIGGTAVSFNNAVDFQVGGRIGAGTDCIMGLMGEILIYNRALSDAELAINRAYLNNKWGSKEFQTSTLKVASTQNRIPTVGVFDSNVDRRITRYAHQISGDRSDLVLNFSGYSLGTTSEAGTISPFTVEEVWIESNTGVSVQAFFPGNSPTYNFTNAGQFDINTLSLPASAWSLGSIQDGSIWWVKTLISQAVNGTVIGTSRTTGYSGSQSVAYVAANTTPSSLGVSGQVTFTGTAPINKGGNGYEPLLLGTPINTIKSSYIATGDSIIEYQNDTTNAIHGQGFYQRALGINNRPGMNVSRSASGLTSVEQSSRWRALLKYATIAVDEMGTNDIGTGGALNVATYAARLSAFQKMYKQYGASKVVRTGYLSRTNSTDNWATEPNQTPNTGWGLGEISEQLNAIFASKVGQEIDVYIPMNSLRDPVRPQVWLTNGTPTFYVDNQGLHPNQNGHPILATEFATGTASL